MKVHPEVELIWWLDEVFTDLQLVVPMDWYKNHSPVVRVWPNIAYGYEDS